MGNVMYEIFMNLQRKSQNNCLEHCSIYLNGVTARPCTSLRPCCLHVQFTFGTSVEWCFEASGRSKGTRHRNFSASFYIFIDRLQEDTIIYKQTRQLNIILATLLKLTRSRKLQRISCEIKIKWNFKVPERTKVVIYVGPQIKLQSFALKALKFLLTTFYPGYTEKRKHEKRFYYSYS